MRRSRLPLLPPLLLAVVACAQLVLAHTTPLTPWKLGGFGMFSTADQPPMRTLRLRLITDRGTFGVVGPRGTERVRTWPRPEWLRAEAYEAACTRWRLVPLDDVHRIRFAREGWETVYGSASLRAQTRLDGLAIPADSGDVGAVVRAVRAEMVRVRLGEAALVPRVIASEAVEAVCPE